MALNLGRLFGRGTPQGQPNGGDTVPGPGEARGAQVVMKDGSDNITLENYATAALGGVTHEDTWDQQSVAGGNTAGDGLYSNSIGGGLLGATAGGGAAETARTSEPDGFRPNPTGDGTTQQFQSQTQPFADGFTATDGGPGRSFNPKEVTLERAQEDNAVWDDTDIAHVLPEVDDEVLVNSLNNKNPELTRFENDSQGGPSGWLAQEPGGSGLEDAFTSDDDPDHYTERSAGPGGERPQSVQQATQMESRRLQADDVNSDNEGTVSGLKYDTEVTDYAKGGVTQVKWEGPIFDAGKNEVSIETLEVAHEGLITETGFPKLDEEATADAIMMDEKGNPISHGVMEDVTEVVLNARDETAGTASSLVNNENIAGATAFQAQPELDASANAAIDHDGPSTLLGDADGNGDLSTADALSLNFEKIGFADADAGEAPDTDADGFMDYSDDAAGV